MDELFRQLGDLFLGSIPTMVLFLVLLFCYTTLVHRPLRRVLAERRERTEGAVAKAHAASAEAERRTRDYEDQLVAARLAISQARERQIADWNTGRDQAVSAARDAAAARVRDARRRIEEQAEQSRASMDPAIDALAGEILQTVLPPGRPGERS